MKNKDKQYILNSAKEWMKSSLSVRHLKNTEKLSVLSAFKINPFLWSYLANYYHGNTNPRALAEIYQYLKFSVILKFLD